VPTPAHVAALTENAKKSRPGRRRDDTESRPDRTMQGPEASARAEAERLVRALCLTSAQLLTKRVQADLVLAEKIDADGATMEPETLAVIVGGMMAPGDVVRIFDTVHDRAGMSRKPQILGVLEGLKPIVMISPAEMSAWGEREEEHAALVAATGGNGHANGHSQH
jgi:hypothetical protein